MQSGALILPSDVIGKQSEVDVSVYDRSNQEAFLGHVRLCPFVRDEETVADGWFKLEPRGSGEDHISGEIKLQMKFQKTDKRHYGPEDFDILKLIGKGLWSIILAKDRPSLT
jgi:hypothetical protein